MKDNDRFVPWGGGKFAICIAGTYAGWVMFKHPDGQWVTQRHATDSEMLAALRARLDLTTHERDALYAKLNTPQVAEFTSAVMAEAAHQRDRWGSEHDAGKEPADWFWLVGYLAGKAIRPGEEDKRAHRIIATAAALANWFLAETGADTSMRPGIEPPPAERRG